MTMLMISALLACAASPPPEVPSLAGPLVIAGGGGVAAELRREALQLAGGPEARVLVVPQASRREDAAARGVAAWTAAGALRVEALVLEPQAQAREAIARADLVWFSGGSQNRVVQALRDHGLISAMRARHGAGAVFGGTSAGAALMSAAMITGEARLDLVGRGTTELAVGLGLLPGVIVDQHFSQRRRFNRLLSAVLDRKDLVGIGIDERTAIVVRGRTLVVRGEGNVLVIDPRAARVPEPADAPVAAGRGLVLHVLRAGMELELGR